MPVEVSARAWRSDWEKPRQQSLKPANRSTRNGADGFTRHHWRNGRGGTGIPVRCDHTDDHQVEALFTRIDTEQSKLDVLVNCAWGGYERMFDNNEFTWPYPF